MSLKDSEIRASGCIRMGGVKVAKVMKRRRLSQ